MRVGTGYDLHRLITGRILFLGGVEIPSPVGAEAHSDGDTLIHAIIDALLGAAGKGDIGTHFPPGDPEYRDISSRILLRRTAKMITEAGFRLVNLDSSVLLEKPRLQPYIEGIRACLAEDLNLDPGRISVKAKTGESMGDVGEGRAVEAHAVVLLDEI
ncbi:MAG TPA: 2-C-methyl-D-erythritol 2,4-cyclodiphosphate synthase [Spirochaetia bacterium]|nr:2-C-methyl-D-erythritol 2,4-cyclodiphosphate synthase [Spirochaetia bacterium]